jgi:hypothetical protein
MDAHFPEPFGESGACDGSGLHEPTALKKNPVFADKGGRIRLWGMRILPHYFVP